MKAVNNLLNKDKEGQEGMESYECALPEGTWHKKKSS